MSDDRQCEANKILAAVAQAYGVETAEILSKDRRPHVFAPRCCVALALRKRDMMVADIGRLLNRDHSSIDNALRRAVNIDGCVEIAERVAAQSAAELLLNNAVRPLPPAHRALVRAYVDGSLLARRRTSAGEQYRGLAVLSASPIVRERCVAALELLGGGGYAWRMRYHAERLGMQWRIE